MFNKTTIVAPRGPDHVTVHEHRAPTDESVRLLAEMQEAVEKRILAAVRVSDTAAECVIHCREDHLNGVLEFGIVCRLNGAKLTANYMAPYEGITEVSVANGIRDALAAKIATVLVSQTLPELFRKQGIGRIA